MNSTLAVVLAAGKGTRMQSDLPKVLVPVCGRPMIRYVIDALHRAGIERIVVVVGYQAHLVRDELADEPGIEFVEQTEQLGTGHAVMVCRQQLASHHGPVLIVTGDSPMLQATSVQALEAEFAATRPACLLGTAHHPEPQGLGRIVRTADGKFDRIVEQKDASPEQRQITEVNLSTYLFDSDELLGALERLSSDNAQGEYYLTDCPGILKATGKQVRALPLLEPCEALSINNLDDLALVEQEMQNQRA